MEGICHTEETHKTLSPGVCHSGHVCVALEVLITVVQAGQLFSGPKEPRVKFGLGIFQPTEPLGISLAL